MNIRINLTVAAALFASAGLLHAAEPNQASLMAQAKLSQAQAQKIALAKVPSGTVRSAELEQEHGALVWSFDIATPKSRNIHEILVNAVSGTIVSTELETPKAQAKERAADKLEMQLKHKH